ncbi:MAG TPA: hypothetical protein PLJ10_08100 [Candidatus Hydrogenedens sp.]|nr:hypothetical protein [Candidatus Hydrogenedens sp.]HOK09611.1 hypothetical protein [Candidatus Hydrogenedens sp.]
MSSITVSWGISFANEKEIYEHNHKLLSEDLLHMIEEIHKTIGGKEIYSEEIKKEYDSLVRMKNQILQEHTYERILASGYEKWYEKKIDEFNKRSLRVKKIIKEIKDKKIFDILRYWEVIKGQTQFIEVNKIKTSIDMLNKLSLTDLAHLKEKLESFVEYIQKYNFTKEQIKKITIQEGEGNIHKKIRKGIASIEKLKDDRSLNIPQKIKKLQETMEEINLSKNLLEELMSLNLDNENYSVTKILSKEKKEEKEKIENKKEILQQEVEKYLSMLERIDPDECNNLREKMSEYLGKDNIEILRNVRDKIKIVYGDIKEKYYYTKVYEEEISAMLEDKNIKDSTIVELAKNLLEKKYIESKEFWQLFYAYEEKKRIENIKQEKRRIFEKFLQTLETKGYSLIEKGNILEIGEDKIIEIQTPLGNSYKIQVKFDKDGQIITRFVKEVEEQDISEYEKQMDKESAQKWCKVYKESIVEMNKEGYPIEIKAMQEPEEVGIIYVERKGISKVKREQKGLIPKTKEKEV